MIAAASFLAMAVTLLLSLVGPVVLLVVLCRKRKGVFGAWAGGALGFFLPQVVIRIPILQFLGTLPGFQAFSQSHAVLFVFLLALTAALFETAGRFLVLRALLYRRLSYMTGVAAGAGHGGIESVMLVGLTYVNNLVFGVLLNAGLLPTILPDPALRDQITQALLAVSPDQFLVAGIERVLAMAFHIALSVLLALFLLRKRTVTGLLLVVLAHWALDFGVGLLQVAGVNLWLIEGVVLLAALLSIVFIVRIRPAFGDNGSIPIDPGEQAVREGY